MLKTIDMNEQDLPRLKKKVDEAKTTKSELSGQLKVLLEQLDTQYSCKTAKAGDDKLTKKLKDAEDLKEKFDNAAKELQEKYDL